MQTRFSFFKAWVENILPPHKVEGFCALWQAPCETNELTESIFGELFKVFNAENSTVRHAFKDDKSKEDFDTFLHSIEDSDFWKTDYWEELKTDPNSIIVIDLPTEQATPKPSPYYYILDNDFIIDLSVDKKGKVEYVIFWCEGDGMVSVIDEVTWTKFSIPKGENGIGYQFEKAELVSTVPHLLNRVPATPIYFNPINKKETLINHNPITRSLGALDWLLFFEVAKKYLETYAPFPIYATYTEMEDSAAQRAGEGEKYLETGIEHLLADGETVKAVSSNHRNRNEANRRLIGPGTIQRYDAPVDKNDSDLLSNQVQVIPAEEISLNYCEKYVTTLNQEIFDNCVGRGGDMVNTQAINKDQVAGTFESKSNILASIREKIEEAMEFVYGVIGELRYGELYAGTEVELGDDYFVTDPEEQQAIFQKSKTAGLPSYELDNQLELISKSRYKDQPFTQKRNAVLSLIEPYPLLSIAEVSDLVSKGYASKDKLMIKIDFIQLIKRFEREQLNVVDFGSALSLQSKINIINLKLTEYVRENNFSEQNPQGAGGSQGGVPNP